MHEFLHILEHSALDTLKLLPFLLLTYLFMEYLEHKMSDKAAAVINRAGKLGPVLGSVMGIVPQCGFSAAMSNLFAGGLITRGTLLAVFLSTSDEMLPILISRQVPAGLILKILAVKVVTAIIAGMLIDLIFTKHRHADIHDLCEDENCHCEHGIFLSALKHTAQILLFVFLVNFALTAVIEYIGEDSLANFIMNKPVIGELLSGLIGLIPNCASSIVITELYLQGGMSAGAMLSGLMTGSGVGLIILFRTNKNPRENFKILAMLYGSGVIYGFLAGLLPIF